MSKSNSEIGLEDWMNKKWRPLMGYCYMIICMFDFIIAPILWSLIQAIGKGQVNMQWQPLTLQGAGLFHISMGTVLGLAAWGRTQEKLNGVSIGNSSLGTTYIPPTQNTMPNTTMTNQEFNTASPMSMAPSTPTDPMKLDSRSISVPINSKGKKVVPINEDPEI